jgi:hypothetical protein
MGTHCLRLGALVVATKVLLEFPKLSPKAAPAMAVLELLPASARTWGISMDLVDVPLLCWDAAESRYAFFDTQPESIGEPAVGQPQPKAFSLHDETL